GVPGTDRYPRHRCDDARHDRSAVGGTAGALANGHESFVRLRLPARCAGTAIEEPSAQALSRFGISQTGSAVTGTGGAVARDTGYAMIWGFRNRRVRELESALLGKTVLLQEVHHRVKNNLAAISSLLAMQAEMTGSSEARLALDESRRRVHSMALIHEHLSGTDRPDRINF